MSTLQWGHRAGPSLTHCASTQHEHGSHPWLPEEKWSANLPQQLWRVSVGAFGHELLRQTADVEGVERK